MKNLREFPPQKIAIVRALPGLGDLLCVVPSLRAIRMAFPQAYLTLIGLPHAQGFVQRFNFYLDEWLEFPGCAGIPEVPYSPSRLASFLSKIQGWDLVLQMHGNGTYINCFVKELKAKQIAGFYPSWESCPDPESFLAYPEHEPEIWRHLRLLEFLGIPLQGDELEFPIAQSNVKQLEYNLKPGYICIHAGASDPSRRWAIQNFAAVGDTLAMQGWTIVLTGTNSEQEITRSISQMMRFPVIDLASHTNLDEMAVLLKNTRLLICNDTGVSHLASALKTNSVVIFINSEPERWAPLNQKLHRRVIGSVASPPTVSEVLNEVTDQLHQEESLCFLNAY